MRRPGVTAAAVLTAGALLGLSAGLAVRRGRRHEDRVVEAATARLRMGDADSATESSPEAVPEPVRRYLTTVLPDDPVFPSLVEVRQSGTLRVGGESSPWNRFTATHVASPRRPGFVWDAHIALAPGVTVRVRDALVDGDATSRVTLFGGLPIAGAETSEKLLEASLQRYLAEAVWYPTALVPGGEVTWEAVDDTTAEATIAAGETTASVTFHFDEEGRVEQVHADRYRAVGSGFELTPWTGVWDEYETRGGVSMPTRGSVIWHLPSGDCEVWRGSVMALEQA